MCLFETHSSLTCSSTQDMIFMECVQHIVESVLQGYNGSIIASGQTGMKVMDKVNLDYVPTAVIRPCFMAWTVTYL